MTNIGLFLGGTLMAKYPLGAEGAMAALKEAQFALEETGAIHEVKEYDDSADRKIEADTVEAIHRNVLSILTLQKESNHVLLELIQQQRKEMFDMRQENKGLRIILGDLSKDIRAALDAPSQTEAYNILSAAGQKHYDAWKNEWIIPKTVSSEGGQNE